MNAINRQKFLAELAKLLTFMYEEDRQYALSMYERMFDIAEDDEQELIQHLMSPTRQAVIIARAYDAKARSLTVDTRSKGEDDYEEEEGVQPFVLAINKIFDDLFPDEAEPEEQVEDQVSFFDLGVVEEKDMIAPKPKIPKAAVLLDDTQEFELNPEELPRETEPEPEEMEEAPSAEQEELPPEPEQDDEETTEDRPETDVEAEAEPAEAIEEIEPIANLIVPESEEPAESRHEAFEETAAVAETDEQPDDIPEPDTENEPPKQKRASIRSLLGYDKKEQTYLSPKMEIQDDQPAETVPEEEPDETAFPTGMSAEKTLSIPLLILFLIVAVPVTLAILLVLLVLTLVTLSLAFGLIALGVTLVVAAFSGFAVLADILLLLGAAIVALALGLLLLWMGIWLIAAGMVGLVRSVKALAEKWCSKEVPEA